MIWDRFFGTVRNLWSSTRGRVAIVLSGLLVIGLVAAVVAVSVTPPAPKKDAGLAVPPVTQEPATNPSANGEDLFEMLPPTSPTAPPVADNGITDIGGPGMVANQHEAIYGQGPMASPNPATGLMPAPKKVPVEKLIVPLNENLGDAQACASPRVPQSRAIANQTLAYLYTWDSSKASWDAFIGPLQKLWDETAHPTRDGTAMKRSLGSTWDARMDSFGFSPRQWAAWAATGIRSEVEVNQVVTLAGITNGVRAYAVRVQYSVTVTRSAPEVEPQSRQETVWVDVYAPCPAAESLPPWHENLHYLQVGDFAVIAEERLE